MVPGSGWNQKEIPLLRQQYNTPPPPLFFGCRCVAAPLTPPPLLLRALQVTLHDYSTYTAKIVGWDASKVRAG